MGPMLAAAADDLSALRYPLLASFKMDGIRATITPEGPRTRSLKEIPNRHVQAMLSMLPVGLDGELAVIGANGAADFRATSSAVMKRDGEPDFKFFVFDKFDKSDLRLPFTARYAALQRAVAGHTLAFAEVVEHVGVYGPLLVREQFARALAEGHEGLILRDPEGFYKSGRSTLREQGMLKVKPWEDTEALIIDVLPEFHNTNEATTNELGRTKRSSAKAGLVQKESMGKLVVQSKKWPKSFEIGTGFTAEDRANMWRDRDSLVGCFAKFSYVTAGGYDVPRHCTFRGIRAPEDMS